MAQYPQQYSQQYPPNMPPPPMAQYPPNMPPNMPPMPQYPIVEKVPEKKNSIGFIILCICGVIAVIVAISAIMPSGDVVSSGNIKEDGKDGSKASGSGSGSGKGSGSGSGSGSGTGSGSKPVVKKPWSSLKEGAPMRCSANELRKSDGSIYRYVGNDTARWYPSPAIASSWDANWEKYDNIDCANMNLGPAMAHNMTDKTIGAPMRCSANELRKSDGSIYRYVGNDTARWYPSPAIASSWDANWEKYDNIDCANMNLGPAMAHNMTNKTIGAPIRCTANELRGSDGSIYRYTGDNTLSHYPNPAIASSWDPNWGNWSNIDCANMKLGPEMGSR